MMNVRSAQRISRAAAEASPVIWDWDVSSETLTVTDGFREIHGLAADAPITLAAVIDSVLDKDADWVQRLARGDLDRLPPSVRYRVRRGDEINWFESRLTKHRESESGKIRAVTGVIIDVTDIERAAQLLRESDQRLRLAIEAGRMAVWEVELKTGKLTQSPELNNLLGLPRDARPTLADVRALYAPGEIERLEKDGVTLEAVRTRWSHGEYRARGEVEPGDDDRTQFQAEFALITPAGKHKRLMLRAQYAPRPHDNPMVTGLLVDVTDQAAARDRLAVVARELRHRIKNTIAVVLALARQTLAGGGDPNERLESYTARLQALALATDSIFATDSDTTDLRALALRITSPFRRAESDNIIIAGQEAAELNSKRAAAVGMVLHEFSTNALKHGALSVATGKVVLAWRTTGEGLLAIEWSESGGPIVNAPTRSGFGSRLVKALVASDLQGRLETEYAARGFRAIITIPMEATEEDNH